LEASIIIPVNNEEKRIYDCLDQLTLSIPKDYEIIVTADGCTDRTVEIAKLFPVKVVSFHEKLGKGGGILNASRFAKGKTIIFTDVDLSVSPDNIPRLVNALVDSDVVLGSRNLDDSIIKVKPPVHRKILGKVFNWIFRRLFKIKIFDTQCGFKAIKKEVLQELRNDLHVEGFAFDADLIVKAYKKGFKINEIPIVWSYKKGSKVNSLQQIYSMGRDMLMIWLETKKREVMTRNLKSFYDSIQGDVYEKACKSWFLPRRLWHLHKNREVVKKVTGKRVLEVGCGSGTIVKRLLHKGKNVFGVDIGKKFLNFCHSSYKDAFFCSADAEKLPFSDNSFDTIICSEVIEHLSEPEKSLKEFVRILHPNGELVITTPNISVRWALVEAIWTRIRRKMLETNHKCFTKKQLRFLLNSTGFTISHNASFMFGCLLFVKARKKNIKPANTKSLNKKEDYLEFITKEEYPTLVKEA